MRIVHVVPRVSTESSGPSISVPSLCKATASLGEEVRLFALTPRPTNELFAETSYFPTANFPGAYRLGVSREMLEQLRRTATESDIIHGHSMWMMPNIYPAKAVTGTTCKLVISPRGAMSPWALRRSRVRKKLVWWYGQEQALRSADCFHATSDQEYADIRRLGFTQPIAIIPNGVVMPAKSRREKPDVGRKKLLYLARIHPVKGVDVLLDAWKAIEAEFTDWELVIAGPKSHAYAQELMQRVRDQGIQRVEFVGEVNGTAKTELFESSDLYVLPTHSENFGISVAEALAHGIPAIVTKGAPWSGLKTKKAGWWIDFGADALVPALREGMSRSPAELRRMGANGKDWMQEDFDWNVIGSRMRDMYRFLLGKASCPGFIQMR